MDVARAGASRLYHPTTLDHLSIAQLRARLPAAAACGGNGLFRIYHSAFKFLSRRFPAIPGSRAIEATNSHIS
jgi:hypothetical protein